MSEIGLQIFVGACFVGLVVVLFFEKTDYLTYSFLLVVLAAVATSIVMPEIFSHETDPLQFGEPIDFFVGLINWEVIFFLIAVFTIVEILNEKEVFQAIAKSITNKYQHNIRKMFYVLCTISTLCAAIIEDLSVALIFGPIILLACRKMEINPTPFLLGMTICINLASTLTPFGSAENILIANYFRTEGLKSLNIAWFFTTLGLYFLITTVVTLLLLDKIVLKKSMLQKWKGTCTLETALDMQRLDKIDVDKKVIWINISALGVFIVLLLFIPQIYLAGIIAMLIFIFVNPIKDEEGKSRITISHYLRQVDYKLIYFFICLFIFVGLMNANGTIDLIKNVFDNFAPSNEFLLAIMIMLLTSLLSGIMDNAPVTILFLPIMKSLILGSSGGNAIIIALIIGINIGGNFLPQGSAADMATLDIAQKNCVVDLSYKRLFKIGAIFALLHILLGIGYLALVVFVF